MNRSKDLKKHLLLALKIGLGCSLAIFASFRLNLDNAVSAGTITLLSLLVTKWETVRISVVRLVSFGISVFIAWLLFLHIDNNMLAFGLFVFLTVLIAEELGWRTTISVNTVVGAHLLISHDFSAHSILNELALVVIGLLVSLVLNLFQDYRNQQKDIIDDMKHTEERLQYILQQIAGYLLDPEEERTGSQEDQETVWSLAAGGRELSSGVWSEIQSLERLLRDYIGKAREYQDNTFQSHPVYYIDYFEMRYDQCQVLYGLHSSMKEIRTVPDQAALVADYIYYLADHVVEKNNPEKQEKRLEELLGAMKKEDMPKSREEFESRALLFHILMDLDSFLYYKRTFVENLDEKQLDRYWDQRAGS